MKQPEGGLGGEYLDLKIDLYRVLYGGFQAEMRLPWGDRVTQGLGGPPPYDYLREFALAAGPDVRPAVLSYGKLLVEWLFQGELRDAYRKAREGANESTQFHVGVGFGPQTEDLQALRWECLRDPLKGEYLSLRAPFVRYLLGSSSLLPTVAWPLRVLVAVANPPGPGAFSPAEVEQFKRAVTGDGAGGLGDLLTFSVWEGAAPGLEDLRQLRVPEGPVQGLALLARAADPVGGPAVLLREGPVPWDVVADALLEGLTPPPALAYLALPGPAAPPEFGPPPPPWAAPLLRRYVQAVVSLPVPLWETLVAFTAFLFEALQETALVDAAVAVARRKLYHHTTAAGQPVAETWGWVSPVLFSQAAGSQWYQPVPPELREAVRASLRRGSRAGTSGGGS
jgi:hypothetical protein